ncbi:RTA1 domain-containing protein [Blastomyces dermatitidis ER-3]|uniref:RTA1 domain-containing protein n=2 Tax=Blastomyces TaxID=229219 RepID=A0A179UFF5_BLAGS|nr:RTA1 domain-containing protein [Blastomyces gilchristii SLH14081]XP_045272426.1 RTA1 domain-containing protein [Blastomyces dermatitidis ER-3]EEQ84466.2 RTA1 domain-containing protein [Blastomyces dermatitidis ER-3]EQL36985.1 hypothetical protein BDFG_01610 [Blastomyces dermatitidis ATCC 26199]OAT06560.1 RTA1 domain-containing protein [Blastomyces gilchristii SLH14081]
MGGPGTEGFSFFQYKPVKGASAVFAVLWLVSGVLHLWQNNLRYKTWRMGMLLPWVSLIFVVGYILREIAAHGLYGDLNLFIATSCFLFCAPPIFLAINSIIFGRVLYYVPWLSPMHPGRVISTFLGCDVIIEALASSGASIGSNLSHPPGTLKVGAILIKISILAQIPIFALFGVLVAHFHRRLHKAGIHEPRIRKVLVTLYLSCVLLTIRNVFRAIDTFEGWGSAMGRTEAYFWCLDAIPILINGVLMNIFPPASCLPRSNVIYLAQDGKTERIGPGWVDDRHFLLTVFDPFDFAGMAKGKDKKTAFWEEDAVSLHDHSDTHRLAV